MKTTTKTSVSRKGRMHRVYFCAPRPVASLDMLATRLTELKLVREVSIMDMDGGYMAKVRFQGKGKPKDPSAYLSTNLSKDFGTVFVKALK